MRDGTTTHARLLSEALRLFDERGVDAVSVRDIAAASDVGPSTLYVHWKSRDELVADLFRTGYAAYAARLAAAGQGALTFHARLAAMLRTICRLHTEDERMFRFLLLTQHANLAAVPGDEGNPIAVVQAAVAAAVKDGEIPLGDPALLTAAVVGIVVQAATFHHYGRLPRGLEAIADDLVQLCLRAVGPQLRNRG